MIGRDAARKNIGAVSMKSPCPGFRTRRVLMRTTKPLASVQEDRG